jgi:hypothetical protein
MTTHSAVSPRRSRPSLHVRARAARARAWTLVAAVAFVAVGPWGGVRAAVAAQEPATAARCTVYGIHATKDAGAESDAGAIPKELQFLADELSSDQFAAYKRFRLLDQKSLDLALGKPGSATVKSGHKITLELLGSESKRLKMHLTLTGRGGEGSLLDTDYRIEDGGVLLVGGSVHEGGRLFFALKCATRRG